EEYLAACLESILDQGLPEDDYQVIIINDGSPDNSKDIALGYAAKHPNFIFIDQENQGVSVARNAGLDKASGEYVAFIDPDDSVRPYSLELILNRANRNNLDLLYLQLVMYDEIGNFISEMARCGEVDVIGEGVLQPRRTFPAALYR